MATNEYVVEYAKTGRASCKNPKCKKNIGTGDVRIGKVFGELLLLRNVLIFYFMDLAISQSFWRRR